MASLPERDQRAVIRLINSLATSNGNGLKEEFRFALEQFHTTKEKRLTDFNRRLSRLSKSQLSLWDQTAIVAEGESLDTVLNNMTSICSSNIVVLSWHETCTNRGLIFLEGLFQAALRQSNSLGSGFSSRRLHALKHYLTQFLRVGFGRWLLSKESLSPGGCCSSSRACKGVATGILLNGRWGGSHPAQHGRDADLPSRHNGRVALCLRSKLPTLTTTTDLSVNHWDIFCLRLTGEQSGDELTS